MSDLQTELDESFADSSDVLQVSLIAPLHPLPLPLHGQGGLLRGVLRGPGEEGDHGDRGPEVLVITVLLVLRLRPPDLDGRGRVTAGVALGGQETVRPSVGLQGALAPSNETAMRGREGGSDVLPHTGGAPRSAHPDCLVWTVVRG